jgi:TetR/AcrR family fatty acid metabolism transcriptional regulator
MHLREFELNRELAVVYQVETKVKRRLSDQKIKELSDMYFNLVSSIITQGQNEGVIRKNLPIALVKQVIIGAIDEVITTWVYSSGKYTPSSMANSLVDIFINGIGRSRDTEADHA